MSLLDLVFIECWLTVWGGWEEKSIDDGGKRDKSTNKPIPIRLKIESLCEGIKVLKEDGSNEWDIETGLDVQGVKLV